MALTPFGKALRKLRIDQDMLLKDMADGVKLTSAFLSAIEAGRKPIPHYLIGRIADWMKLGLEDVERLRDAAALSAARIEISLTDKSSIFDRTLANQLARNFEELDEGQKFAIKNVMDRRKT